MKYHIKTISRVDLPAYERARSEGFKIRGDKLCFIRMDETGVSWEDMRGVSVDVPSVMRGAVGIVATMIGTIIGTEVEIVDVIKYGKVSYRTKSLNDKKEAIGVIVTKWGRPGVSVVMAPEVSRPFLMTFDETIVAGGLGLLLWRNGFRKPFLCRQ